MQPIIKRDRVQVQEGAPRRAAATSEAEEPGETERVRSVIVDGVVRALEVRCGCGQVNVVELDYDNQEVSR